MGRLNYAYNSKYLADFSFGWQASEQISDKNRYVFFPAVSLGWILSEESFLRDNNAINFLKLRASHGLTGNDAAISYYQKLSFFESVGTGYLVGTNLASYGGFREGVLGNPDILPEKSRKSNLGFDVAFLRKLSLSGDAFFEETTGIITTLNNVPDILGTRLVPTGNAGIVENKGFELDLGYGSLEKSFKYRVSGNVAYAKNKIIDMQEQEYPFPHNYRTGNPVGARFGLEWTGYFNDATEIASSPIQTYGPVSPGDLKYRDITNDGQIDIDDIAMIGKSWMPELSYGANIFLSFKGFDFNALVQGIANSDIFLSNYAYYDFYPNAAGNLMEHHLGRWAYDPDLGIDTRETATYPRLSLMGDNTNNKAVNSTFWLKDASYLRLKSIELGYSIPENALKFIGLTTLRVFASAYNVFTLDNIEIIDPEMGNSAVYPIQKMINFGINAQF
jgi:TonB-linked SusC/RagA family outer membrane protein